jgi:hypothetical protein
MFSGERMLGHTDRVPQDDRSPTDGTSGEEASAEPKSWLEPQIGRRFPLPSNRACALTGVVAGLFDGALLLNDDRSVARSVVAALFLGVFVYGGMRFVTATRRKIRPDESNVDQQSVGLKDQVGAPKGGWANPTGTQKFTARIRRIISNYGKRRPPRR